MVLWDRMGKLKVKVVAGPGFEPGSTGPKPAILGR